MEDRMAEEEPCRAADGEPCDCAACDAKFAEEEAFYRTAWEAERGLADLREAYDITDPKHPDFAETIAARADAARDAQ